MELKSSDGKFEMVSTETLHTLKKIAEYIQNRKVMDTLSSAWRKLNELETMLKEIK